MSASTGGRRAGVGASAVDWLPDSLPDGVRVSTFVLSAQDGGRSTGLLYEAPGSRRSAAFLIHPRVDFSHHYMVPSLLRAGISVWTQNTRNLNNDLTVVNERLLLDLAAGMTHVRQRFHDVTVIGNSGGASLVCLYLQQALRPATDRLDCTPAGSLVDLAADLALPDRLVLLAAHPGQADWLANSIDASVTDEADPTSVDPRLDLYDERNGFRQAPDPVRFDQAFIAAYRSAQRDRIARIDERARDLLERRRAGGRGARATQIVLVHRTDADPRCVDLALEPSARERGSISGPRPERTNDGFAGLGRLSTPDAWLSNWSVNTTNAALRLTLPEITLPTMHVTYTADQAVFPSDVELVRSSTPNLEVTLDLEADHYGFALESGERTAAPAIAQAIDRWGRAELPVAG